MDCLQIHVTERSLDSAQDILHLDGSSTRISQVYCIGQGGVGRRWDIEECVCAGEGVDLRWVECLPRTFISEKVLVVSVNGESVAYQIAQTRSICP